jgi:hypothetical protein
MSTPIDLQLRGYTEFFETQMRVVDLDEIMERHLGEEPVRLIGATTMPQNFRPRRGWPVAVASAAAVFALLGATALLFRVTASEAPVATVPPIDSVSSLTWSRVTEDEAVFGGQFGQSMFDVTAGGPGLVAVGESGPARDFDAAVWTSPDGITWSRVPHNEAIFGGEAYQGMSSVTVGGPGLVAVGSDGPHTDRSAAVWTSPDGVTWTRVPHDEAVFGGGSMHSVTVGGPGLVAVGADGNPQTAIHNAVVWTSPDGITWSRVPHDEAIFGGETGVWMSSVTAGGPGLVAVGSQWSFGASTAAVWTSPDGITWSRVSHNETVFAGAVMGSVIAAGPGLVAVGSAGSDAAVWASPDGTTWSRAPHDEAIFGGEANYGISSVTAAGPGLVAVGGSSFGQEDGQGAVWTSPDGVTWSRVPHNEAVFGGRPDVGIGSVTVGGPGLVAVGESGWEAGFNAAVWNARVED